MSLSCYVYYRIAPERASEAASAARRLMQELAARFPVSTRLARKLGEPMLWMEIYDGIGENPAPFLEALDRRALDCGIVGCLASGARRHVEVFECA